LQDSKISIDFFLIVDSFSKLQKNLLKPKGRFQKLIRQKDRYLDVYPFTLSDDAEPTVSLTLQLGWIISRVDIWKKYHKLRFMGIVEKESQIKSEEKRLKKILHTARIIADIKVVYVEDSDLTEAKKQFPQDNNAKENQTDIFPQQTTFASCSVKQKYYILNKIFQRNSSKTSIIYITIVVNLLGIIFTTLSKTPGEKKDFTSYLEELDILTKDLPPIMLVHGSTNVSVISTEF
jgi:hypothetical protein